MQQPTSPMILGDRYGRRKVFDAGGHMTAPMHRGQDYVPAKAGARVPVYAIADGTVRWTSTRGGIYNATGGTYAVLEHGGPWRLSTGRLLPTTWAGYCHLSRLDVVPGQQVRQGEQIGLMGATGAATGVHLHLDIFDRHPHAAGSFDSRIDPLSLITPNLGGPPAGAAPETPAKPADPIIDTEEDYDMPFTTITSDGQRFFVTPTGFTSIHSIADLYAIERVIRGVKALGRDFVRLQQPTKADLRIYRNYLRRANGFERDTIN